MKDKLDKRNTTKSQSSYVLTTIYCVIFYFPFFAEFWALRRPDSSRMGCRLRYFIFDNLVSRQN